MKAPPLNPSREPGGREIYSGRVFRARERSLKLGGRTLVMGVVNVTPDSFSDGGEAYGLESAVARACSHAHAGADIIDVGGESTRPGSEPLSLNEELNRVIPVIERLTGNLDVMISVDTYKSEVARRALEAGAHVVNDISGGVFDPEMAALIAEYHAGAVLMHIRGTPRTMQVDPVYDDLLGEIRAYLAEGEARLLEAGVSRESILVDPGIGFGKTLEHNLRILANLDAFRGLGIGLLVGTSRKSFIGKLTGREVKERLPGTLASVVAVARSGADVVRVHDVSEVVDALKVNNAILNWVNASNSDILV